jgi:hypothetical protein
MTSTMNYAWLHYRRKPGRTERPKLYYFMRITTPRR